MQATFLSIGEAMVELAPAGNNLLRHGFAGDTLNSAYYARKALPENWTVEYFTALGLDPISDQMLSFFDGEMIGSRYVQRHATRVPGLYMVHLQDGERSFSYWRSTSAAKTLANDYAALMSALTQADIIIFSGITLAILEADGIENLFRALKQIKNSGKLIAFDPNIRPRLWQDPQTMRETIIKAAQLSTVLLPSFDDEAAAFGDRCVEDTVARYQQLGLQRIIVKNGAHGALMYFDGQTSTIPAVSISTVVDTTGAGDSFNGSFLGHFAKSQDAVAAAKFAVKVAANTVGHFGALVPHAILASDIS